MSLPTSARQREIKREIMLRRISWGGREVWPWGPCFRRARGGPVGFFLLALRGLKRVRKRVWKGRVGEWFRGR